MKTSLFTRSMAFGALAILSCVSFSCNDSGNAGYDGSFDPGAKTDGSPTTNLGDGANNALTGLALGQDTLNQVSTATHNDESDSNTPDLNNSKFAATAAPDGMFSTHTNANGSGNGSGNNSSGHSGGLVNTGGRGSGSGGASAGGGGGAGGGIGSLGDTHTAPIVDPSKAGPNGDGTMSAADALGKNGSDGQGAYAAGGGGGSGSGKASNPFASLFGGSDGSGGAGGGAGNTTTEFRSPASLAGQAGAGSDGSGPMGSQDPANYFTLLNTDDNLFKIVERRYVSKSKQWAVSEAQDIRRSVNR